MLPASLSGIGGEEVAIRGPCRHARAQITLRYHIKLREMWKKENTDPGEKLRDELPGAIADAWAAWAEKSPKDRGRFLKYVDEALDDLLGEAEQLRERLRKLNEDKGTTKKPRLKVRKLGALPPEEVVGDGVQDDSRDRGEGELRRPHVAPPKGDEDLAEFERQEILKSWREGAKFSKREMQVNELDLRTDYDTAAIARELDITEETVRGLRKRYTDELRRSSGL